MPVKGVQRSQLLALGAVVIYQVVLLYQHERYLPVGQGIKPLLRAACFMTRPQLDGMYALCSHVSARLPNLRHYACYALDK
jgi:hypothetical protein